MGEQTEIKYYRTNAAVITAIIIIHIQVQVVTFFFHNITQNVIPSILVGYSFQNNSKWMMAMMRNITIQDWNYFGNYNQPVVVIMDFLKEPPFFFNIFPIDSPVEVDFPWRK